MGEQKAALEGLLRSHILTGFEQLGLLLETQGQGLNSPEQGLAQAQGLGLEAEDIASCRDALPIPSVLQNRGQNHDNNEPNTPQQRDHNHYHYHNPTQERAYATKGEETKGDARLTTANESLLHCLIVLRKSRTREREREREGARERTRAGERERTREDAGITNHRRALKQTNYPSRQLIDSLPLRSIHMGYVCPYTDIHASCGYDQGTMGERGFDWPYGGIQGVRMIDRDCLCHGKLLRYEGEGNEGGNDDGRGSRMGEDSSDGGVCRVVTLPVDII